MTTILELAAQQIAQSWMSDIPAGEYIAPLVEHGLGTFLKTMREASGASSGRSTDDWARQLFAIPKRRKGQEEAAEHVARLILNWLPDDMRTCGTAIASEKVRSNSDTSQPDSSKSTGGLSFETVFSDLKSSPKFKEIKSLLKQASPYDPDEEVLKNLRKMIERLRSLGKRFITRSKHILQFKIELEKELRELPERVAIATGLAGLVSAEAIPRLRSSGDIGRIVHKKLQTRYISLFRSLPNFHRVVAEDLVYRPNVPYTDLTIAAREEAPIDRTLQALVWARLSLETEKGVLRDDLIDLSTTFNWEIKPIFSSPLGVIQESWYRMSYNFCATVLLTMGEPVKVKRLIAGPDLADFNKHLLESIPGPGWTARPFCLDVLPGMILYFVLRGLTPEQLAVIEALIIAIMLAYLKRLMDKLQKLDEAVTQALQSLRETIDAIARPIIILFLIIAGLLVLAAAAYILGRAVPVGAGVLVQAAIVAGVIVYFWPEDDKATSSASSTRKSDERVNLSFENCKLVNFPISQFPKLVEIASRLYHQSLNATFDEIKLFKFPESSEGTIPVAPPM